jgi:hypothetical protein
MRATLSRVPFSRRHPLAYLVLWGAGALFVLAAFVVR